MSLFNSPLSREKANRLIRLLNVPANGTVLDIGCGDGEFLIQVIESYGARGMGIDIHSKSISRANKNASLRLVEGLYEFVEGDVQDSSFAAGSFDTIICMGSTHAFGMGDTAYPNALDAAFRLLRPGGKFLVGEGYWKQPPAPEYLALLGDPSGIYHTHTENIHFAEKRGWIPLYATVSSVDEWDDFEWSHRMRFELESGLQPTGDNVPAALKESRIWRDGYLQWGRSTMGFGIYLFAKPCKNIHSE